MDIQRVTIGIISLRNTAGLVRLLKGIAAQKYRTYPAPALTVLVVDNDPAGSARTVIDQTATNGFRLRYVPEPRIGIPLARNAVLKNLAPDCQAVVWIDDDEEPSEYWLESLLVAQAETKSDIVIGPVEGRLPEFVGPWLQRGGFFNRRRFADRASLVEGATNNSLMLMAPLRDKGLRFEESHPLAGGTDILFFHAAARAGLTMSFAKAAEVLEHIPLWRCNFSWLWRRHYRTGNSLGWSDRHHGTAIERLRIFASGISSILRGIIFLPMTLSGFHEGAKALLMIARGCGIITGLLGHRYLEFKPRKVATA